MPTIDLFPQYIIDDDMYSVCGFFLATSYLVNDIKNKNSNNQLMLKLKVVIVPKRVVSVYDEDIIYVYNIDQIAGYIESKQCISYESKTISESHSQVVSQIYHKIRTIIEPTVSSNVVLTIIIDRKSFNEKKYSTIYLIKSRETLSELNRNYFISMEFNIMNQNAVCCHLYYGLNEAAKMRFYPEHLIKIIPRLFVKNYSS
eukprot:53164_1